jgi:hypothetical protein
MSDYEGVKRRFNKTYAGVYSFWSTLKKMLTTPIKVISWYLPLWVSILILFELFFSIDILSSIFINTKELWIPLWIHFALVFTILLGTMKKERLNRIKPIIGIDPKNLRTNETMESTAPKNNAFLRIIAMVGLASGFSTANIWYVYLSPFNDLELGINLNLGPLGSFIDMWVRVFRVDYIQSAWLKWLGSITLILLILSITPVTRWLIKRTRIVHVVSIIFWVIFIISMGFWWDNIFGLGLI